MSNVTFRPVTRLLAVAAAVLALSGSAKADSLPLYALGSDGVTAIATGTVSVQHLSSTQAAITLSLTNTNPAGGKITGFGFCAPGSCLLAQVLAVTSYSAQCDPGCNANFGLLSGTPLATALNDLTHTGKWLGSTVGGTGQGLGVGQSGTFTFNILGLGLNDLTAASLLNGGSSAATLELGVQFDPNLPTCTPEPCCPGNCPPAQTHGVPAPPSLLLAGLGLGSLFMGRFRRASGQRSNA